MNTKTKEVLERAKTVSKRMDDQDSRITQATRKQRDAAIAGLQLRRSELRMKIADLQSELDACDKAQKELNGYAWW